MPNDGALADILPLYRTWRRGRPLDHGFTPWRDLFRCLKTMRPRGPWDRIPEDAVAVWRAEIAEADIREVRVEAELFFRQTAADRGAALARLEHAVAELDGEVVTSAQIPAIAYHDLSNYSGKDLSRLHLRLAAIPCDKDVWACPDLRSGRVLSRGEDAARPSRLRRLVPFGFRPLTRSKWRGRQLVSGHGARCEHAGGALIEPRGLSPPGGPTAAPPRPHAVACGGPFPRLLMRQGAAAVRPRQPACGGSSTAFRPKRASSLGCHGRTAAARGRMTAGKWVSAG
jgi:hypothetical protein